MANLTAIDSFDEVYKLETTDPVLGGSGGISNEQAQALLNRTYFLKNRLGKLAGVDILTSSTILTADQLNKLININADGATILITLPDPSALTNGVLYLSAYNVNKSQVTISGSIFYAGKAGNIYLGNDEQVILISDGSVWNLLALDYDIDKVGDVFHSYKQSNRAVPLYGQLLNRSDYPRLFNWANSSGLMYSEVTWLNNINFQGFFSSGNGSTTFRIPDLRGQFIRGFDANRGLDNYRTINSVGGYEPDDNKSHYHDMNGNSNGDSGGEGGIMVSVYKGSEKINATNTANGITKRTMELSGTEARPKNISLIPQMYV